MKRNRQWEDAFEHLHIPPFFKEDQTAPFVSGRVPTASQKVLYDPLHFMSTASDKNRRLFYIFGFGWYTAKYQMGESREFEEETPC